ncbi:MAG: hypothetical protein BIFFINMI_00303 [Phycisphaerae bacterium]|nr:hypothetical protein [Phycisphaerae bacterium]
MKAEAARTNRGFVLFCACLAVLLMSIGNVRKCAGDTWLGAMFTQVSGGSSEVLDEAIGLSFGGELSESVLRGQVVTTADMGKIFEATAATDPHFATVASLLTNGVDDYVFAFAETRRDGVFDGGIGCGYPESWGFFGSTRTDFKGATIQRIALSFWDLAFTTPNDVGGTDLELNVLIDVYGEWPLHTQRIGAIGGTSLTVDEASAVQLEFSDPAVYDPHVLFEGLVVTAADIGRTFTATAATDPDFDEVVALLTNGQADDMTLWQLEVQGGFLPGGGHGVVGSDFDFAGLYGTDFQGMTIESISITIENLTYTTPGDLGGTDSTLGVTVKINVVPEPASLGLFMLGATVLAAMRRKGSRR